jgi:oxygen-independent coproporphyrinogen-3 oxidase
MEKAIAREKLIQKYAPIIRDFYKTLIKAATGEDLGKFIPARPYLIYVHIPFCTNICRDCNYSRDSNVKDIEEYCDCLIKEIELLGSYTAIKSNPTAIYFGGGTPSLLPLNTLAKIMEQLRRYFIKDHVPEISLEVNPSSFDFSKLDAYRDLGINRLSLGIQSFHDAPLKEMGRTYTGDLARNAVQITAKGGWNFNVDLIYGFDAQTPQMFYEDVDYAINNGVTHIATYSLGRKSTQDERERRLIAQSEMYYHIREVFKKAGFVNYFMCEYARNKDTISEYTNAKAILPRKELLSFGTAGEGGTVAIRGLYKKVYERNSYMKSVKQGIFPAFFLRSKDPHVPITLYLMDMLRATTMTKMDVAMFKQQFFVDPTEIEFIKELEEYGFINIENKKISLNEDYLFQYNRFYNDIKYFENI